jgi:signal transduction histidine kinase
LGKGTKRGVFRSATLTEGIELEVFNARLQRWTHSIAVPLRKPDGTLLGAIQSALDVTQLRETEAALQRVNEDLETRVQLRTDELNAASEELQRAMQQLVQSEKLAALGGLVAGVAHELNTPIGNAMTVVTTLIDHLAAFRAEVDANTLRRNQINSFIDTCREACVMLERNTQRAAELIASFKQVAVDQTSMRRRQFSLREAVEETLLTVAPGYKHQPVTVTHNIPEALELNSYPGALEQAISTLVDNAVIHARGDRPQLSILISAQAANLKGSPAVSISVQDDGVGMSQEVARKVFDPFFTTHLGHGGSGLGLYVVYSLVTGVLGGIITLRTLPELGSCFTVVVPLNAPEGEPE